MFIKKIVSLWVSVSLLGLVSFSSLQASSISLMNDSILGNVTSPGVYTDPTNDANYLYGGNVVFKFKDSSRGYPLLFTFSPPKIKAGCNGISVTGGMLSMLGLDGIADQIQNAGTAVVYGILIGLIYSLPALEKVFQHIRQWAEWLQKFLRSACSQGRNLGLAIGQTSAFKDVTGVVATPFQSAIDKMEDWTENTFLQPSSDPDGTELTNWVMGEMEGDNDSTNSKSKEVRSNDMIKNFKDFLQRIGIANVILYDSMIENGPDTPKGPNFTKLTPMDDEAQQLYTLLVNMFGEISIDEESSDFMREFGSVIVTAIADGVVAKDIDQTIRNKLYTQIGEFMQSASGSAMAGALRMDYIKPTLSPERAAKLLIHGSGLTDGTSDVSTTEELRRPEIMTAKVAATGSGKMIEAIITTNLLAEPAPISWKGLYAVSKEKIDCQVKSVVEGACSNTFGLVVPGSGKYIKIIQGLELKAAKEKNLDNQLVETPQSTALKEDLASFNAYFFAKFILNYIETEFRNSLIKLNGKDLTMKFDADFAKKKKAIMEQLDEIVSKDSTLLDDLRARFQAVELEQKAIRHGQK